MNTGVFITARLGSQRLKRKHLLPVHGRPLLYYLIERIKRAFEAQLGEGTVKLVIVTSDEPENREFERLAKDGVFVFYGSKVNIPLRHLQAARASGVGSVISVDGDDILCSVNGMRAVYDALRGGAPYAKTANLPFGMNSSGYSEDFLESCLRGHLEDTLETGWDRIFDQAELEDIQMPFPVKDDALRFTLDYHEDYEFFKAVIEALGDRVFVAGDEEVVSLVVDKKLHRINGAVSREYWENFYRDREQEREDSGAREKGER